MIEGCLDWQANGLVRPESVQAATQEYFDEQDVAAEWLQACCDADPGNMSKMATTQELFLSWSEFTRGKNELAGSQRQFSQTLQRRGFTPDKNIPKQTGGGYVRGFRGVRLLGAAPDPRTGAQDDFG